jgi:ribosomal protein S4
MFNSSSKKERRLGTPLFLKPFRSATGKAAMARRPGKPGQHGQARTRRGGSEFGKQLAEKQKIQFTYGIRDSQMRIIFKKASKSLSTTGPLFVSLLERRLDNVVYRLGFAPSRSVARQVVGHGHIFVNGERFGEVAGGLLVRREQHVGVWFRHGGWSCSSPISAGASLQGELRGRQVFQKGEFAA